MNLATRLALAFAVVAAAVAATVGVFGYSFAVERVTGEVDRGLRAVAAAIIDGDESVLDGPVAGVPVVRPEDRSRVLVAQRIAPDGSVAPLGGGTVTLPVGPSERALAGNPAPGATVTSEVAVGTRDDGVGYRVVTTAVGSGRGAVQVGIDIHAARLALDGLAIEIAVLSALVTVVAAGLGRLVARRIARRLVRLTAIAEQVGPAGLGVGDVPVEGRDEVARLSSSFTTMLRRLAESREAQERLIQDAAHELRTPLTSLRTNASVLRRIDRLGPEARERLLADVEGETRELSNLVDELIALALARRTDEEDDDVDLCAVVRAAAERTRRRTGREVVVESDGTRVRGQRAALERAVGNLLENAAKFDTGRAGPIEIRAGGGRVAVSDRGPGLAAEDVGRIFDRFYRADAARSAPGSGLGLAIVADIARAHDGATFAGNRPGGGATVGFTVGAGRLSPGSEPDHDPGSPGTATVTGT